MSSSLTANIIAMWSSDPVTRTSPAARTGRLGPTRRFAPRAQGLAAASAALLAAALGLVIVFAPLLTGLEASTLSARFSLRAGHPTGVVVVAIDDRSFAQLGHQWPFPRSWHGRILEQLRGAGARAVFYDIQFTEPTTPTQDTALYDALRTTGGAVLATTQTDGHGHSQVLGGDANLSLVHSRAAVSNFPVGAGGVIDRMPYAYGGLNTAPVAMAQRLLGRAPDRALFRGTGAYIDFQGGPGSFPTLSFSDVLRGRFAASAVRGKVVVVGAASPSLQDLHPVPGTSDALMSGPELQANAIWTALHGVPLRPAPAPLILGLILLAAAVAPIARWRRSVPAVLGATLLGAASYVVLAQVGFDAGIVLPVVGPLATLALAAVATLAGSHLLITRELRATQLEIVHRLGRAAELRDGETGRHLERMAFMVERLALASGLSRRDAKLLHSASALHDVGKISIPDEILLKPGRFEEPEREVMKTHAAAGARMLAGSGTSLIQLAEMIARTHHERWDGSGYPAGLMGDEIPLAGRICSLCDVFDALISRRRYKDSWSLDATLSEIQRGAGTAFDPDLTQSFLRIAPRLYRELVDRVDPDVGAVSLPPAPDEPTQDDANEELAAAAL
jgi:HD-GYP domain-containing protein (c-di-GMP phosphodiesterase class II)